MEESRQREQSGKGSNVQESELQELFCNTQLVPHSIQPSRLHQSSVNHSSKAHQSQMKYSNDAFEEYDDSFEEVIVNESSGTFNNSSRKLSRGPQFITNVE